MVSGDDVARVTKEILRTVDLAVTSERDVRRLVSERLGGHDVSSFKLDIKRSIRGFVKAQQGIDGVGSEAGRLPGEEALPSSTSPPSPPRVPVSAPASSMASGAREPAPESSGHSAQRRDEVRRAEWLNHPQVPHVVPVEDVEDGVDGKKRKATTTPMPTRTPAAGTARGSGPGPEGPLVLNADPAKPRHATVDTYKGQSFIAVREYYVDKADGSLKPSRTGVTLNAEAMARLLPACDHATRALEAEDESFRVELNTKKHLFITCYQNQVCERARTPWQPFPHPPPLVVVPQSPLLSLVSYPRVVFLSRLYDRRGWPCGRCTRRIMRGPGYPGRRASTSLSTSGASSPPGPTRYSPSSRRCSPYRRN